jgi:hypothetical protein
MGYLQGVFPFSRRISYNIYIFTRRKKLYQTSIQKGGDFMIYMHDLQRETLKEADELINGGKTYTEIIEHFFNIGYQLRAPHGANGQPLKSVTMLYKNGAYSFVDIKKKRNGGAIWETVKLS